MFALVAARPVTARELLRDAPRSLRALSNEHKDGWGVAIRAAEDWIVHRSTACAAQCDRYGALVDDVEARLIIAHVRQKTVGETSIVNTHPFRRGTYVFAHNGTVRDVAALAPFTSAARLAEIEGQTDSERLFAFVLTQIDRARDVDPDPPRSTRAGVIAAVQLLSSLGDVGSTTFLLSCGAEIYAHRRGRTLFALTRHAVGEARRTASVAIASECLTGEPWQELPEGSLWVLGGAAPRLDELAPSAPTAAPVRTAVGTGDFRP